MIARITAFACFLFSVAAAASHGGSDYRGPAGTEPPSAVQDGANVLRSYDVSLLEEAWDLEREPQSLLPYLTLYQEHGDGWSEAEVSFDSDTIAALLRNLYSQEFEYEGRRLSSSPDGHLLIEGPEGLHTRVASLLAFLDRTLNAQIEIAVDVIRVPADSAIAVPSSSIITSAAARDLITAAVGSGNHEHYTMRVPTHRTVQLSAALTMPLLIDYDVEIAQSAAIADPVVATTSIGTNVSLRAAPSATGTHIAAIVRRGQLLGDVQTRTVRTSTPIAVQDGVKYIDTAAIYQDVDVVTSSFAFDAHLDAENAIVLQSELALGRMKGTELIILRQVGGSLPIVDSLAYDTHGTQFSVLDMSFVAPPRAASSGRLMEPGSSAKRLEVNRGGLGGDPLFAASIVGGYTDFLQDILMTGSGNTGFHPYGPHMFLLPYSGREGSRAAFGEEGRKILERIASMQPSTEMFDVSVTVARSGEGGHPAVRIRMPLRSGQSGCAVTGIESMEILDYDVEVAQEVSVADAQIFSVLDGLAIWVKPTLSLSGNLVLEIRGAAHLQRGAAFELPLQIDVIESVDQSVHDTCFVSERVTLQTAQGSNSWHAVFGGTGSGGSSAVRIEVDVRR